MRALLALLLLAAVGYLAFELTDAPAPEAAQPATGQMGPNAPPAHQELAGTRRASLEQRWRKARSIAVEKWRADVLTANVLGEIGARPPMLRIEETSSEVRVTNASPAPVCLSLARITRPNTDAVNRCQVGPQACAPIKPGASVQWKTDHEGNPQACLHAALEFRVGNVDSPEPTWWSRTAFNAFSDPPLDISYKDEADLHADIARFEATVEDSDRAARWRRDLAAPRH